MDDSWQKGMNNDSKALKGGGGWGGGWRGLSVPKFLPFFTDVQYFSVDSAQWSKVLWLENQHFQEVEGARKGPGSGLSKEKVVPFMPQRSKSHSHRWSWGPKWWKKCVPVNNLTTIVQQFQYIGRIVGTSHSWLLLARWRHPPSTL